MPRHRKTEPPPDSPAAAIKAWRRYRGLTQAALEDRIGKKGGTISGLEGTGTRYTQEHLQLLAKAFQCTPAQVLIGPPEPGNPDAQIVDALRRLTDEQKLMVLSVIESLDRQTRRLKVVNK